MKVQLFMCGVLLVMNSCSKEPKVSKEAVLQMVGDTLNGAVDYLFKEIPNRKTTMSKALTDYYRFADSLYAADDDYFSIRKQLTNYFKQNPRKSERKVDDESLLTSEYVANSILNCYKYKNKSWNSHLSDKEFFDYVLPYKIGDEEIEDWRSFFQERYGYVLDSLAVAGNIVTTEKLCELLVTELKKHKAHIFNSNIYSATTRPSTLSIIDCGTCKDYCDFVTLVSRSFGLPVATDGLLGWHTWNALITKEKTIDFYVDVTPDKSHLKEWLDIVGWHNMPKVYRETYCQNEQSLAMTHGTEAIPSFFKNPYIVDVTNEYYDGFNYSLSPKNDLAQKQFAYLKVWNNGFVFVDWARRQNEKVFNFSNISDSVVYFPSFYVSSGANILADYPFIISDDTIVSFVPNKNSLESMTLWRKYFVRRSHNKYLKAMVRGRFVGSNTPDFSDAEFICEISELPKMSWNEILTDTIKQYRYVRYESPDWSNGNVGEIEFYSVGSDTPIKGIVIGTDKPTTEETVRENAFDGNVLTYFEALLPHGAWVGIDFGKPMSIAKIRYIPRNDDNFVQKGQEYELMYADLEGWKSMGRKIADADSLVYDSVPSGAIYLLKNRTKGHEERVFSYSGGKQIWW